MSPVSLIKGQNRREIARQSLELIAGDIEKGIQSRQIVIKSNFVSSTIQLASSHVEQIRGILDFLRPRYPGRILAAEAARCGAWKAYRAFDYLDLPREYPGELVEMNDGPFSALDNSRHNSKMHNISS